MKNVYKVIVESEDEKKISDPNIVKPCSNTVSKVAQIESPLIEVTDKSRVGRPKEGESQKISAKLKIENYYHARLVGGKYGGITAYINYLIEQDMKKEQ